jgi:hypothetical protein
MICDGGYNADLPTEIGILQDRMGEWDKLETWKLLV